MGSNGGLIRALQAFKEARKKVYSKDIENAFERKDAALNEVLMIPNFLFMEL